MTDALMVAMDDARRTVAEYEDPRWAHWDKRDRQYRYAKALISSAARIKELEAALKPFADLGRELGDGVWSCAVWKDELVIEGVKAYADGTDFYITVGDLRRAGRTKVSTSRGDLDAVVGALPGARAAHVEKKGE